MNNLLKSFSFNTLPNPYVNHFGDGKILPAQKLDKSLQEEGEDENTKNQAEKKELDRQKVNDLVKKANRCIISISSVFPWNIFPNTIEVEESRVNFITHQFMSSQ